jgi:hypothetical protein
MKVFLLFLGAILFYFSIHLGLSRWSQHVITVSGQTPMPPGVQSGFYYIPVTPLQMSDHPWLQICNVILAGAFYPCHLVDKAVLGGPDYAFPPLRGLSGGRRKESK